MAETAILLNIGDMIDLAIGTPEVGVVDFNMLQTVLHCLAQQMRVLGKNVELRGSMASIPTSRENTQTIEIKEFAVEVSDDIPTKKAELPQPAPVASEETILVVERVKRADSPDREFPKVSKKPSSEIRASQSVSKKPPGSKDASQAESRRTDPSFVTFSKFNLLEKAVEEMRSRGPLEKAVHKLEQAVDEMKSNRITDKMSKPSDTPSKPSDTQSQPQSTGITDKTKPLEQTIDQLDTAINDMKSNRPFDPKSLVTQNTFKVLEKTVLLLEQAVDDIRAQRIPETPSQPNDNQPLVKPSMINALEKALGMLEKAVDEIRAQRSTEVQTKPTDSRSFVTISMFNVLEKAFDEFRAQIPTGPQSTQPTKPQSTTEAQNLVTLSKFNVLEKAVDAIRAQIPTGLQSTLPTGPQSTLPAQAQNLVTLSKFNVLEKAVEEMRAHIPTLPQSTLPTMPESTLPTKPQSTLPTEAQNLVSKFNLLEKAFEEFRAQIPTGPQSTLPSRPQSTLPTEAQNLVTLSKFNVLEKAVDEIRAQIPTGPQSSLPTKPQSTLPAQAQNLVTLSKFNVLEKAVDEIRARHPTVPKRSTIPEDKLVVLEKSVAVLERAIKEIKDHRPDDSSGLQSLTGPFKMLERAVEILDTAVEEMKSDQYIEEPQKTLVTLSKFNLLEKAVDVLDKTLGEVKSKTAKTQPQAVADSKAPTLSLVTLSKFNLLKQTVEDIKDRVFSSIPNNESLLEEVRSQTNIKAIQEMWQSLNVQSRLEAAEMGLGKLSSLVGDLISESAKLQDAVEKLKSAKKEDSVAVVPTAPPSAVVVRPPGPTKAPAAVAVPRPGPTKAPSAGASRDTSPTILRRTRSPGPPPGATTEDLLAIKTHLEGLQSDVDGLMNNFLALVEDMSNDAGIEIQVEPSAASAQEQAPPPAAQTQPSGTGSPATQEKARRISALAQGLGDRVNTVERRMLECCATIGKVEGIVQDQLNSFQDQLEYLLKQVGGISTELSSGKLSPDLIKDLQGLMALFQTVQDMQTQLQKVHDTALQLASEKDDRQQYLNSLLEQIDLLKIVKLDREDMVEAMADKADLGMLAKKVSHDRFETACDDLSKGLEHALGKLNLQEALWQQALDDIQREIETKLDKMELSPVKQFFNSKLQMLQENLKQMASLRKEAEAAGTKRRLLRDVNCISCDANAVMAMDVANALPVAKPLPANLSMKPYLSYELDTIRKSQQAQGQMPGTRNMHDWENIDKQMTPAKPLQKVRSDTDKHLCNRYCGGSHTMTTPSQRVARLGHFIKQWGPDVLPLSSGMAAGDDGRMYRVTAGEKGHTGPSHPVGGAPPEPANTPRPSKKLEPKPDSKATPGKYPECRCLETCHAEQKAKK